MKKLLLSITLIARLCLGVSAYADTIDVNLNSINVTVDGNKISTSNILWQGTTYIPLRSVSEALKCNVTWDSSTSTAAITKNQTIDYDLLTMFTAQYKTDQIKRLIQNCESIYDKLDYEYTHKQFGSTTEFNQQTKNQIKSFVNDEVINNVALKLGYDYSAIASLTLYVATALEYLSLSNEWLVQHYINPTNATIEGYQNTRMKALISITNAHNALNIFQDDMMNYVINNYSK